MGVPSVFNNENFIIPENFDTGYGDQLTAVLVAICANALSKAGGSFTLTADVDFGPNFGLIVEYIKSEAANIASTGVIRLANGDTIDWRNANNTGDLPLGVDANNLLIFNGNEIIDDNSEQVFTNKQNLITPFTITDSSYTLQSDDIYGVFLIFNSTSSQTLIIPADSTTIPIGAEIPLNRMGTGSVTISPVSGTVTLLSPYASNNLRVQYSSASIVKTAQNTWLLVGDFDNSGA